MSNIIHVIIKAPKYPKLVFVYLFIFSITSRLNIRKYDLMHIRNTAQHLVTDGDNNRSSPKVNVLPVELAPVYCRKDGV